MSNLKNLLAENMRRFKTKNLSEQIPAAKVGALNTINNVVKSTKTWEPIVAEFSKKMKASLTKSGPKENDPKVTLFKNSDDDHWNQIKGHGILFGMNVSSGTLQNGGKSIKYEKETDASKNYGGLDKWGDRQFLINNYYLTLTADYAQTYNPDIFEIDAKLEGIGNILGNGEDENGDNRLNSGDFTLDFTISINKVDRSNTISYGIEVGNFNIGDLTNGTITGMDIGSGMTTDELVKTMGMAVVQGLKNNDNYCQIY
jgi:hypothetical protein